MSDELLRCPFCGGEASFGDVFGSGNKPMIDVECLICGACCYNYPSAKEAALVWNTREKQPCDKCDRINKWVDHVRVTPNKARRYDMLLEVVKEVLKEMPVEKVCDSVFMKLEKTLQEMGEIE